MNDEQYRLISNSKYGSEWVIYNDDIVDDPLSAYYKIEPGEQLFLYYGKSYREFRTYSAGNPSSVQCPNDVRRLFPSGVPWSCVVQIPRKLLDEQDSDDDPEWKPGRRGRR